MTRKYLLCLFFLCGLRSLGVNSTGESFTNSYVKLDDGCYAEKTVKNGRMVVKEYSEEEREKIAQYVEQVRLYCKPGDGFQGMQIEVQGKVYYFDTVNFTAEELGISTDSRWYDVNVTFSYRARVAQWDWYINVSVKIGGAVEKLVNTATTFSSLTTMTIYSLGPSAWRVPQPDARCYNQSGQNTISTAESKGLAPSILILVIVLGIVLAITISITIAVACKSKRTKTCVLPRVNVETEDDLGYEVRCANGRNMLATRPGSAHDSENSLYGVL